MKTTRQVFLPVSLYYTVTHPMTSKYLNRGCTVLHQNKKLYEVKKVQCDSILSEVLSQEWMLD